MSTVSKLKFENATYDLKDITARKRTSVSLKEYEHLKIAISGGFDWSVALQTAIDELSGKGGGTIFAPSDLYLFANHINLKANIRIIGEGSSTIFKLSDNSTENLLNVNGRLWFYTGGDGVSIENIVFDGNGVNQNDTYRAMTVYNNTSEFKIKNVDFKNVLGSSLNFLLAKDFLVSDVSFTDITGVGGNPGEGVYVYKSSNGVLVNILGSRIDDHLIYIDADSVVPSTDITLTNIIGIETGKDVSSGASGSTFNIVGNSRRISLSNCHSYQSAQGFRINTQNNVTPKHITLTGCSVNTTNRPSDAHGFVVTSNQTTPELVHIKIDNCKAFNCGGGVAGRVGYGFIFVGVEGVSLTGIDVEQSNDVGVQFSNCKGIVWNGGMSKNNSRRFTASNKSGIQIGDNTEQSACHDITINGVSTTDTLTPKLQSYGVFIRNFCTNITVNGGSHRGNANGTWLRDSGVDASCVVLGIPINGDTPMITYNSSFPVVGYYKQGDIVWNTGTSDVLLWKRLTNGNSHLLGTDWKAY